MRTTDDSNLEQRATRLAERLMARAAELESTRERHERARLGRVIGHPSGLAFLARLLDRTGRVRDPRRLVESLGRTLRERPKVFHPGLEALLDAWRLLAPVAPRLAVPPFLAAIRHQLHRYIVSGEPAHLRRYLARRNAEGIRVNLNLIGEAVLSSTEAETLLMRCEAALSDPSVEALSVKISALCPRLHPLAHERMEEAAAKALIRLYRAAGPRNLVSLDMESFADLEVTVAAFKRALSEPGLESSTHGLALQAYLPESLDVQSELTTWARGRVAAGGAPIRLRLVKGANLGAERFEATLRGIEPPTFLTKRQTDAQLKRMLSSALEPENAAVARIGVGTHNVFDVALALTLASERATLSALTIEMLHGMAEPLLRAVVEIAPEVLVYAPVARADELLATVAYLLRRLDENAAPQHFLRHAFTMRVGDRGWRDEAERFREASALAADAQDTRISEPRESMANPTDDFRNEPEADWARRPIREEVRKALASWAKAPPPVPRRVASGEIDGLVTRAREDRGGWSSRGREDRKFVLLEAAEELRARKLELIAALAHDTNKPVMEADPEVCEAIDYARWYARSLDRLSAHRALEVSPRGVVLVISPWNFPLAIPLGGVLAALIGGNRVILKPSPYAERVARLGAEALWKAGVPEDALQVVPCSPDGAQRLASHPGIDALVFTGSTATAKRLLEARPALPLVAETGGKNAILVAASADRDRAIADILRGAFSHAGQKCSAASLVVAEAEVFDDPAFRERLVDAVRTLRVGPATDPGTEVPPLVTEPGPTLAALHRQLPRGERWALEPVRVGPRHFTPGVVWNVQEGSPTHLEEVFGPVVGVMRARDLTDGIRLVNASGYGLTSALESLDESEWRAWIDGIHAGNLYVNRPLVGAVVRRQPFGGWGRSGFGPGAKTGGIDYAAQLVVVKGRVSAETRYDGQDLLGPHHTQRIPGQLNFTRHRPARGVVIRIEPGDDPLVARLRIRASHAAGADVEVSSHESEPLPRLCARLQGVSRVVRCGESAPAALVEAAARSWTWVCREPLTGTSGDLLPFLLEQSISIDTQRHGWIAPGADDFLP